MVAKVTVICLFLTVMLIGGAVDAGQDLGQLKRDIAIGGRALCKYCWACAYESYCDGWVCWFGWSSRCNYCDMRHHCHTTCETLCNDTVGRGDA